MTCNLTLSGLGGSSAQTNRDFGVIDTNTGDVAESVHIFDADWSRTSSSYTPAATHLLVSPVNARAGILGSIAGTQKTLHIEDEEMYGATST